MNAGSPSLRTRGTKKLSHIFILKYVPTNHLLRSLKKVIGYFDRKKLVLPDQSEEAGQFDQFIRQSY